MTIIQNFVTNNKPDQLTNKNINYLLPIENTFYENILHTEIFFKTTFFKLSIYRPP